MVKKTIKNLMDKLSISSLSSKDRIDHELDSTDPKHEFLEKFCSQNKIESFFEIGTMEGKSLKKVVENSPSLVRIGSCDTWQNLYKGAPRGNHNHIVKLMDYLKYDGEIEFFDGESHEILPNINTLEEHKEQYDLVLINGEKSSKNDMQNLVDCWPLVKPGGIIIFDNIGHQDHLYLEEIFDVWIKENKQQVSAHAKYRDHNGWAIARKCDKGGEISNKENIKRKIKSLNSFSTNKNLENHRILDEMKDSFAGETCYILSCGPSLGDINPMILKAICETNLIVSIKQAGLISGEYTDIQLFNCCNVTNYPTRPGTMFVGQADNCSPEYAKSQFWPNQKTNVIFQVDAEVSGDISKEHAGTLADSKEFDKWTIDSSGYSRPFGPGIMYETVFFLLKHLGISTIRTIGWDFQDPSQEESWNHFYEDSNRKNFLNPGVKPYPNEAKKGIALTKDLCEWFASQGIRLEVMNSELCYVHEDVPRFSVSISEEQE